MARSEGAEVWEQDFLALDPNSGAEAVLISFCGQQNCTDGEFPGSGVIDAGGTFYGTSPLVTQSGHCPSDRNDIVFSLNQAAL
jgi:hypothetical protein